MDLDYKKLGLKCGLEVHQQLDTGKLFCRCPSKMREDKADIIVKRKLHAAASELGEYDVATLEAFKKGQEFIYELYSDSTCLIEADEEPPKPVDREALETVLKVSLMLGASVFDEIYVMRKTVVDGSNTSGFQRTALVANGGSINTGSKDIGIQVVVLEEDAGRTIKRTDKEVVYRLDRLGIPLIEIATDPHMNTPEEVKECALALGTLLRRTCKAKRGLGTIRQDLNISIKEGARTEIKGVQELENVDEYVRREVLRQKNLIEIKKELEKRGLKKSDLKDNFVDVSGIFNGCDCKITKKGLSEGKKVYAVKLPKFKGLIGKEIQPDRRFGTELAGHLKAKIGVRGLFHSDELPKDGITEKEVGEVEKKLNLGKEDAFVLVCEEYEETKIGTEVGMEVNGKTPIGSTYKIHGKAKRALQIIIDRCKQALEGVPGETRNAIEGGNNEYSRPLPGAARMYPETDIATIHVDKKILQGLKKALPLTVEERLKLYKKHNLSTKLAEEMKLGNWACFYERLLASGYNPTKSAVLLLEGIKNIRRTGKDVYKISEEMIEAVLKAEKEGKITQDVMVQVLGAWAEHSTLSLEQLLGKLALGAVDESEIRAKIDAIIEKNKDVIKKQGERAVSALMGEAMKELRGKASGKMISELLKEEVKKYL